MKLQNENQFSLTIRKLVTIFLRLIHLDKNESAIDSATQFVKFGLVGLTNTILSYGINVLVLKILSPYGIKKDYVIANITVLPGPFTGTAGLYFRYQKGKRGIHGLRY